jgi:methyl-accepting chemotaxis protein
MSIFNWLWVKSKTHSSVEKNNLIKESQAKLNAISRVLGVIEFTPEGTILSANDNFLAAVGYSIDEIAGKHHSLFMPVTDAQSSAYADFWKRMGEGAIDQGQYKRLGRDGKEIWLQASYNPVFDEAGKVVKIIKYANVITEQKLKELEFLGQMAAVDRVFGVIEFTLDGQITKVNKIFMEVTGYTEQELIGRHHRIFMQPEIQNTQEYQAFWQRLGRGEYDGGVYKRLNKNGQEIWLQATYNPIFDEYGKPYKIVKYATDITAERVREADVEGQLTSINHIMAVIEFDLHGNILHANDNFLKAVGYEKSAVIGQHHRMFVLPEHHQSASYLQFWQDLSQGKSQSGMFQRIGRNGKNVWLRADYNPILDPNGKPYKIVKYATDITESYEKDLDNSGQINSINRSLGTIEFSLDGRIEKVNQNFLDVVGYTEREVLGQHHRLFMPEAMRNSMDYQTFWQKLARGEFQSGVFHRLGKQSNDIWLQASYNPVLNEKGIPVKIVKFATNITPQKLAETGLIQAVAETQQLLEAAQHGNMSARIGLEGKTEQILNLSLGINGLMDMVSNILLQVKESADTINTAANEISSGNSDLSTRTERQAHSLLDTASNMSELAGTVKLNADHAKQANALAVNATKVAERGGDVVENVVQTMSAINESAKKIEDIISVIDGIAFQTNILALNAAVEAARAGEQGKGFAVVAGEVRNLAQRSAIAAKEIKELIANAVNKTMEGTLLVEGAGKTMAEIVASVKHVGEIIGEISTASSEQTVGIDQVNVAISSMDDVTQQNAALVEEAAAAAESLVDQSNQLSDLVAQYHLQNHTSNIHTYQRNGTNN